MHEQIIDRFTTHLKNVLISAQIIAKGSKQDIQLWHLFFGVFNEGGSLGAEVLDKAKFKIKSFQSSNVYIKKIKTKTKRSQIIDSKVDIGFSVNVKRALEKAFLIASQYEHRYVGTEHLLFGILEIDDQDVKKILESAKVNISTLKSHLKLVLKTTSKFPQVTYTFSSPIVTERQSAKPRNSILSSLAVDLTSVKMQQGIDPVITRDKEINRIIHVLNRRTKNNPLLIGEPGVGKTAIVEGLAKRIMQKEVPEQLLNKKIWKLDLGLLVAGTMWRGEFESRIKQMLVEIEHDQDIILFIDELHTIIGAGAASGSLDVANLLKPALARGKIRCIGATTLEEYDKHIATEGALERRFQSIVVDESTLAETIEILGGVKKYYEVYHSVSITGEAIQAAAKLSHRYIQDRFLPDKAIDLLDEACSKIKTKHHISEEVKKIKILEDQINACQARKRQAIVEEKFELATHNRNEITRLMEELSFTQKVAQETPLLFPSVEVRDIITVVEEWSGVQVEYTQEGRDRLLNLENVLSSKIVGHKDVVKDVSTFMRTIKLGLIGGVDRPLGSLMMIGPSGVGKTELAKMLANILYPGQNALIHLDMSEFAASFNISKLIGAPPGYVGYRESGFLTAQVKKRPYSVILFDEIDKAHPDVFNLLLQILEYGHCRDATGKEINFKNTILIMTSNVGQQFIDNEEMIGFGHKKKVVSTITESTKNDILKEAKKVFTQPFLNRIDKIVFLNNLDLDHIEEIIGLKVGELNDQFSDKKITIALEEKAKGFIAKRCYNKEDGARAVRKAIHELILNPLVHGIMSGDFVAGHAVKIILKNNKILLTI